MVGGQAIGMRAGRSAVRELDRIDPDRVADLRRRHGREETERVLALAEHVGAEERALLRAVFEGGVSVGELARVRGCPVRTLRREVRGLVRRVTDPRFVFVLSRREGWGAGRRKVASACVLQGLSLREAAREAGLTLHTVRRHMGAIEALFDAESAA
ncbi:MAG: hypothetical protein AB7G17_10245 [Phycisphaerales bacterium]